MLYKSLKISPDEPRDPPNTCVSMGKLNILDHKKWSDSEVSLIFLYFLIFSSLGPVGTISRSDLDSLTCLAAQAWSQSSLGCPGCSNISYRSWHSHMRKNIRPFLWDNYLKYHSYEPETLFNRRSSIRSPMEKLLEWISFVKFHRQIGFRTKISEFVIFHKN